MKILIVDDEQDVQSLFRQKFKKEIREGRLSFQFSFSAEEALRFLDGASAADVVFILSDINMPGMNGIELLGVVKERFPHLSVFMITAYDDADKRGQAVRLGADEYLTKPIDFSALRARLFPPRRAEPGDHLPHA